MKKVHEDVILPVQPIVDGRFVANEVVEWLLDNGGKDMNDICSQGFSREHLTHFAQLIGYSLGGFGSLPYVDDETYSTAEHMQDDNKTELEARNAALREELDQAKSKILAIRMLLDEDQIWPHILTN